MKDNTNNNECSRCGECCGLFVPFNDKELEKIKQYVNQHNITPSKRISDNSYNAQCCFYDSLNKQCKIYEVRPFVCKDFKCNHKDWIKRRDEYAKQNTYNSLGKKLVSFDDAIYKDYEPILRFIFDISKNKEGNVESSILIDVIKYMKRLDLLNYFSVYDENNNKISGVDLLKDN